MSACYAADVLKTVFALSTNIIIIIRTVSRLVVLDTRNCCVVQSVAPPPGGGLLAGLETRFERPNQWERTKSDNASQVATASVSSSDQNPFLFPVLWYKHGHRTSSLRSVFAYLNHWRVAKSFSLPLYFFPGTDRRTH